MSRKGAMRGDAASEKERVIAELCKRYEDEYDFKFNKLTSALWDAAIEAAAKRAEVFVSSSHIAKAIRELKK